MQQIRSEAATTRWRSNGAFNVPMVLRCAIGGYVTGGAIWHSQCGESIFTHIPGLIVMFPCRARDVVGLLRAAFRCEDPVLFLEHKHLFRQRYAMDPYPGPDYVVPLGKRRDGARRARTSRSSPGARRCTARCSPPSSSPRRASRPRSSTCARSRRGTKRRSPTRSRAPRDSSSSTRTSLTCGFGAEIAAFVADECFADLDAPVRRVGAVDTWVGYEPSLERAVLPQVDTIVEAARALGPTDRVARPESAIESLADTLVEHAGDRSTLAAAIRPCKLPVAAPGRATARLGAPHGSTAERPVRRVLLGQPAR